MELSVSAWCLQKKLYSKEMNILDFVNYCHENGVNNVELLDCFFDNNIEATLALVNSYGMSVSSYSIGNDFVHKDPKKREAEIDYVIASIDTAISLNTKFLRIFCGDVKEGITFEEGKTWILEALKKTAKYAEAKKITMVLENHGFLAGKSDQVKEILETVNSPYLKSNSDVGNFMLVEENPLDAVKKLKDHLGFIHFKDFKDVGEEASVYKSISDKHFEGMILGKGDVPLKDIVNYLRSISYNGYLSIEYEGIDEPIFGTTESIKYAQAILKK